MGDRPLSEAEIRRLERLERTRANKRGRKNPAAVPARLARTSAFAPKRRNLITDSKFRRAYIVPGHSYVEVSGRELGSQHRDALYAVFRMKPRRIQAPNPATLTVRRDRERDERLLVFYETQTTWRELVRTLGLSEHPNNLLTLLTIFEELQTVVIRVQEGDPETIEAATRRGQLAGAGMQGNIIETSPGRRRPRQPRDRSLRRVGPRDDREDPPCQPQRRSPVRAQLRPREVVLALHRQHG